jgi:uncharacterized protein with FMN-binding domain
MKRVLLSILGTAVGLVGLLSFKSHGHPAGASGALPSAALPAAAGSTAPKSATSTSAPPQPGAKSSPAASAASGTRVVAGDPIETPYGIVQVQVTLTGNHIDSVKFLQLQAFDGRSQQINSYAAPTLLQETLQAQSAQIDTVSGATYTSDGYAQSVQSALDKAGVR